MTEAQTDHGARGLLFALLATAACHPAPPAESAPRNLLLIAVDTLRADHLGAYGYERPTSPAIDRLLESSVVFEQAHSTSSWTLPAFASLMTSLHSSTHGCWQFDNALDPSFTTLAELLSEAGYHTGGVVSHVFLGRKHGLQQGFEEYDERLVAATLRSSHRAISSPDLTDSACAFLEARAQEDRPWFLFAHYFDPHKGYQVHAGIAERFGAEEAVDKYDGEIAFTDRHVGRLLDRLESLGLAEETIVAFVGDHGEEFGDHGGRMHGATLYREVTRVPFALRVPGLPPRRVETAVSLVDFLPTTLELLDLPKPDLPLAGRSLVGLMQGGSAPEVGALMELRLEAHLPDTSLEAYVAGGWKLIVEKARHPAQETRPVLRLYDLRRDPAELEDVAAEHPEVVERMLGELRAAVARAESLVERFEASQRLSLSEDELERLRELGYVGDPDAEDRRAPDE